MSKQYIFVRTPMVVVLLIFLLVVIYGIYGSRVALFRLNMLLFPIIFLVSFVLLLFNQTRIDTGNLLPVFKTGFQGHIKGISDVTTSYIGIGVLWLYIALVKQP